MYKNFYNFNLQNLLKIRLHLGHKDDQLNLKLTSYLYGTRHNINIYDLDKL
jgi:ribosomal protein S2